MFKNPPNVNPGGKDLTADPKRSEAEQKLKEAMTNFINARTAVDNLLREKRVVRRYLTISDSYDVL